MSQKFTQKFIEKSEKHFFDDFSNFDIPFGTETKYQNTIDFFRYWMNNIKTNANIAEEKLSIKSRERKE